MYAAELFALAAALCWSTGGILSTTPTRTLGAVKFNRLRISFIFVLLSVVALFTGGWHTLTEDSTIRLTGSALVGILIGDTCYFAGMKRLGPRRSSILFTTNAPMTVILGYFLLGEELPTGTLAGCAFISAGVFLAVFHGTTTQRHSFEQIQGSRSAGLILNIIAAFCQAMSLIIARPALASGADAVAASGLRAGIAAVILTVVWLARPASRRSMETPATPHLLLLVVLSGLVSMGLGMTFLLKALSYGCAGLVSTLSAMSPVLVLPVLWIFTHERPAPLAWVGAILAVAGMGFIFCV